jgi:nitrate reductase NapAB chaperone NapD
VAISGAVVVPLGPELTEAVLGRLKELKGVEVKAVGPGGIAVVMEADRVESLESLGDDIKGWDDVLEVSLAYLNWEDGSEPTE